MNDLERKVAAYGEKPSDLDEEACLRGTQRQPVYTGGQPCDATRCG